MSNITGTIRAKATLEQSQDPLIYNVPVLLANTEVSQALTVGTKIFTIRVRGTCGLKLAFVSGQSGTNYITIPPGANYNVEGLNFSGTLYFQTSKATQIVEILEWS